LNPRLQNWPGSSPMSAFGNEAEERLCPNWGRKADIGPLLSSLLAPLPQCEMNHLASLSSKAVLDLDG
jgi:hypothetical protein